MVVVMLFLTKKAGTFPPVNLAALEKNCKNKLNIPAVAPLAGKFDLVVVGEGIAGMSAAVSAARLGMKVSKS